MALGRRSDINSTDRPDVAYPPAKFSRAPSKVYHDAPPDEKGPATKCGPVAQGDMRSAQGAYLSRTPNLAQVRAPGERARPGGSASGYRPVNEVENAADVCLTSACQFGGNLSSDLQTALSSR
jgi:hypothetical protein